MAVTVFRRPPRREPPPMPAGVLELHAPPPIPEKVGARLGDAMMALPMLGGLGSVGFMFASGNRASLASGMMFGLSSLGMGAASLGRMGGGERRKRLTAERRDYMRHLSQIRRRSRAATIEQREALTWLHPHPLALVSLARTNRLWERRPYDPDFATVRIGTGAQQLALDLQLPELPPVDDIEPLSAAALRRFTRVNGVIDDLPVALATRSFARVDVEGPLANRRDLTRSLLVQAVTWHAPTELAVCLCVDEAGAKAWDWLKWLPHALHPSRVDRAGPLRLVTSTVSDVEDLLADELAGRPWFARDLEPLVDRPHLFVIVDGGQASPEGQLSAGGLQGVTVFNLRSDLPAVAELPTLRLRTDGQLVSAVEVDRVGTEILTPVADQDQVSVAEALELARAVAPMRMPAEGEDDQPLTTATGLTDLLGVPDARTLDPALTWRPRPARDRLRVAIGVGANGAPVELDIKEAAQGGMGPHGLLIGATGSGKSELLRTLVLGLAMTHSPEGLNFILVDFKGGATFTRLEELPHTSAVITNLAEELTLVDRMQDAISGEVNRRQELLRAAGNFASIREYDAARAGGAALDPLPSLFVVVDEFSELLSAKPDFIDLFVMIGRLGRSLGVHLLLASQRLEEGKLRGLDTYLSYRVGLKTFSAAESRVVLGVPDAYELPTSPGNGYLKFDTESMVRFKAAYVSGPYRAGSDTDERSDSVLSWSRFALVSQDSAPVLAATPAEDEQRSGTVAPATSQAASVMDVVLGRLENKGRKAHRVWLPPLAEPPTLDELLPPLGLSTEYGFSAGDSALRGALVAPMGLLDRPYEQRRDVLLLNFSGAAGHGAVVGAPQSGKSTTLRSILTSLALLNTAAELQIYCLDFGGGALAALGTLPHVGVVANRLQRDLVVRTVNQIARLLDRREAAFVEAGVDSIVEWRRRVRGGEIASDGYGDVFLVVDGIGVLRENFEDLEPTLNSIASRGLNFGVHVLVGATRWAEIRPALRDLLATRLELRLGDPSDSEVGSKLAALVPVGQPGRGLTSDGLQLLSAVSRIDGLHTADGLTGALTTVVARIVAGWSGPVAPPVRLLPTRLDFAELIQAESVHSESVAGESVAGESVAGENEVGASDSAQPGPALQRGGPGVLLGLSEEYEPLYWDPDVDQHMVVIGASETGKTSLLRVLMQGIGARRTPEQAQVVLLDPRRGLLEAIDAEWLSGSAVVAAAGADLVTGATTALAKRVPGMDIGPDQLRERSWWHGPELFVVIDDLELSTAADPLSAVLPLLPYAHDIGLHVIVARSAAGISRAMYEPAMAALRDAGAPFVVLDVPSDEGTIVGSRRVAGLPPGRGRWVSRRRGEFLVQIAR